jgi:hypothetical protein
MDAKISIVSRSGSCCRHEVLSAIEILHYKERLVVPTTMQGRSTEATYRGTRVPGYYKYCGYRTTESSYFSLMWLYHKGAGS